MAAIKRTSVFSEHKHFDPTKRIQFRISSALALRTNETDFDAQIDALSNDYRGRIMVGNTYVIPSNHIKLRFRQTTFYNPEYHLLSQIYGSVRKQPMTDDQKLEFAMRLGTVWTMVQRQGVTFTEIVEGYYRFTISVLDRICYDRTSKFDFGKLEDLVSIIFQKRHLIVAPFSMDVIKLLDKPITHLSSLKTKGEISKMLLNPGKKLKDMNINKLYDNFDKHMVFPRNVSRTFPKKTAVTTPYIGEMEKHEVLTEKHRFIEKLVENLENCVDVAQAFENTIQWMRFQKFTSREIIVRILTVATDFNCLDYYDTALADSLGKIRNLPPPAANTQTAWLEYFNNQEGKIIKKYVALKQKVAVQWNKYFFDDNEFPLAYYNLESMKEVYVLRHGPKVTDVENILTTDEDLLAEDATTSGSEETLFDKDEYISKGIFGKMKHSYDTLVEGLQGFIGKIGDTVNNHHEASAKFASMVENFNATMSRYTRTTAHRVRISRLQDTVLSIQKVADFLFASMIDKVFGFFGLEGVNTTLSFTKMMVMYVIWVNVESKVIKTMIILDILVETGVIDKLSDKIVQIYSYLRSQTVENVNTGDWRSYVGKLQNGAEKRKETLPTNKPKVEDKVSFPTMLETIYDALVAGTPYVLGTIATILLGKLSYDVASKEKSKDYGEKIIAVARNMSFLALGLGSVPKIISHCAALIKFVIDYAKKFFVKAHVTEIEKINKLKDFLKNAYYSKSHSPTIFAKNPVHCFEFMKDYIKLKEMSALAIELRDTVAAHALKDLKSTMDQLYTIVRTCIRMFTSNLEPFHIQFYSKIPGVGKTDMTDRVVRTLKSELSKISLELNRPEAIMNDFGSDVMYFNDNLSYADAYYYQRFAVFDEINVFKTIDPESIIQKMIMFSGNPCMANKASLEDKGMLYDLRAVISSTNTAYPEIEGMFNKDAYLRRRKLFSVRIKSKYMKADGTVDFAAIDATGMRTSGQHLEFRLLQSTTPVTTDPDSEDARHPDCEDWVDVDALLEIVAAQFRHHVFVEESRLAEKNPLGAAMKAQFDILMEVLDRQFAGDEKNVDLASLIAEVKKKADGYKDLSTIKVLKNKIELGMKEHMKTLVIAELQRYKEKDILDVYDWEQILQILETQRLKRQHMDKFEAGQLKEMLLIIPRYLACESMLDYHKVYSLVGDIPVGYNEETASNPAITSYELIKREDGYHLVSSDKLFGVVDFDGIDFSKVFISGMGVPVYRTSDPLPLLEDKIRSYLSFIQISSTNYQEAKMLVDRDLQLQRYKRITTEYDESKRSWMDMITATIKGGTRFVYGLVKSVLGFWLESIVMCLGVVIGFLSLRVLGQLLTGTVETASYRNKGRGLPSHGSPPAINVNTGYEANPRIDFIDDNKMVQRGTFRLYFIDDRDYVVCSATMVSVGGGNFATVKHAFANKTGLWKIAVYDHIKVCSLEIEQPIYTTQIDLSRHVIMHDKADLAIITVPGFRSAVDLTKHFVLESDLERNLENFSFVKISAILLKEKQKYKTIQELVAKRDLFFRTLEYQHATPDEYYNTRFSDKSRILDRVMVVQASGTSTTQSGDSGAPAVHDNTKMCSRNIIGLCCSKDKGIRENYYISVVSQEMIVDLKKKLSFEYNIETCSYDNEKLSEDHELFGVFKLKEDLRSSPYRTIDISKSLGFTKSPIHGVFPVESQPALQSQTDARIPPGARHHLQVSLNKYNGDAEFYLTLEQQKQMKRFLFLIYNRYFAYETKTFRVFSTREAITGIRMMGSTPINYHSSAGLPYSLETGVKGKSPMIRYDEDQKAIYIQDRVFFDVEYYEQSYERGKIPQNFKSEYRKKELVGMNKIVEPKTRTIGTGNMIHQIIYNKVFKDMFTKMKNVWGQGRTSVYALGLDMEKHADQIVAHIRWEDYVFDFDVKAWEKSVNLMLCTMAIENRCKVLRDAYLSREEKCDYPAEKMMLAMTVDFMDSDVIYADVLYRKFSGLLSGHPGTFMENSDIHLMLIHQIILELCLEHGKRFSQQFILDNIRVIVAADDILLSVSPSLRKIVTADNLRQGYRKFGFQITGADKSDRIEAKTIYQCQFLKHMFRKQGDCFVAEPLTSIIYQLFNWISAESKLSSREQFLTNVENAFRFSYWRGEEFYDFVKEKFNLAAKGIGFQWELTFKEIEASIKQQHDYDEYLNNAGSSLYRVSDEF